MAERATEQHLWDSSGQITSTGSANAYVIETAEPITGYIQGMPPIRFKANFANTGSATVNVNGIGAKTLKREGGAVNLARGDIASGGIYTLCYDGTNMQVLELNGAAGLPFFDVRDFGAVGNGTTDDSTAFQAALDAAAASSDTKRVYVPHISGGYAIGATLTIDSGVTLFGENRWGQELSRIKPASGFTSPLIRTKDYTTGRKLRVRLEGLFFDGSSTTLTAIQLRCQESILRDLTVKNCYTYGIHIGGFGSGASEQALNNHIIQCYLAGLIGSVEFYEGVFLDYFTADNTMTGCYIEACQNASIRSRAYNDIFFGNHLYSSDYGYYSETSADKIFSNNYVELMEKSGVLIDGGGSDVATLNAAIHGNVFRNIDTGNTQSGVIVVQGSDISSLSATGNVVRRDASTAYSTPYFVYFNAITPTLYKVANNSWQSGLITTAEDNVTAAAATPGHVLLASGTVSAAATLDIVLTSYTAYRALKIVLTGFLPATDDRELWMRFSTNGGSTYDAGASNYLWVNCRIRSGSGTANGDVSAGDTEIMIAGVPVANFSVSNAASEGGVNAEVTLWNQVSSNQTMATYTSTYTAANTEFIHISGSGKRNAAQDTDAVRFLFATGNITSGNYAVYGLT